MKKLIFLAIATAMLSACENAPLTIENKTMILALTGDFTLSTHPFTRALEADGKAMTDVWIFDYVDGQIKQQLHQTADDEDFGTPTLTLAYGTHHIYAVVSRGQGATLDLVDHLIAFDRILDTFWADYSVTVTASTPATATVTLDRVVTKFAIAPTDPIPTGTTRVDITPQIWYYGIDWQTGEAAAPSELESISITIPAAFVGTTTTFNIFGFSSSTEWGTDITVESYNSSNAATASVTIPAAPFLRNRVTEYSGAMWSVGSGLTLSLNTEWHEKYTGTW